LCDHDRPRWRAYAARVRSKRPLQVISETSLCAHHRLLLVGRAVFHILFGAAVFRRSSWHITRVRPRARPHLPRGLRFALVLRGCRLCVTMPRGGNSSGEEVRDGSHDSNRGRDNRGDISPTALRLLRVGAGRAGPYTSPQGRAPPYSPFRGAALRLRGPLGGETIIVPGRLAHSNSILELPVSVPPAFTRWPRRLVPTASGAAFHFAPVQRPKRSPLPISARSEGAETRTETGKALATVPNQR
jgi:hypothetical protein